MEKKYLIDNPKLIAEWNYEKNIDIDPSKITLGSDKKVWWVCKNGHEWQASIASRSNGNGCPYCSGRYTIKGENDLKTVNPTLASEWNYEKNNTLTPMDVKPRSNKKVWWICQNGHEWQASIDNRSKGVGCPYCSGKKVLVGYNDLKTINPTIANEWNYEKNTKLTPMDVTPNSNKKVWWKCEKGHEWETSINHRNNGRNCPYCAGKKVINGYTDLLTTNPILSNDWNYEKNNGLTPKDVSAGSNKKVWWVCKSGHEWQATISSRSNIESGCPICSSEHYSSFPEYAIVYYLKKCGLDVIHSYKLLGYELDIYIPTIKVAIEYDGFLWHKSRIKNDLEKNFKCNRDGIRLYRVREGLPPLNSTSIDFVVQKKQKNLSKVIKKLLAELIDIDIDVDVKRDSLDIESLREHTEKNNSLLHSNPELAKEWNYEKNNNLIPSNVLPNSDKKVWWKCEKGHEWRAVIGSRNKGAGCPYCANKKILVGYNDLKTINPTIADEWHYEKNIKLTPMDVAPNSHEKVWWRCSKGHEWQAIISSRNKGTGCPYCSGRKKLNTK